MRPLSLPAAGSITALMRVGLPESIAAFTARLSSSGVNATTPDELKRAVNAAMDSGKPTLINAVIDPAAGSESGRIGNLNPQSQLKKK